MERRLSDDEAGFILAIRLTALHHCEGLVFFKLFTLLAKYLLRSDLRAVDIISISPVLFHVSMVEGVLTESSFRVGH